jgi:hypothetical protein
MKKVETYAESQKNLSPAVRMYNLWLEEQATKFKKE